MEDFLNNSSFVQGPDMILSSPYSPYSSGLRCVEQNDPKPIDIDKESWIGLSARTKDELLNNGFFPYMDICNRLLSNLPIAAKDILLEAGFYSVDYSHECMFTRIHDDDVDGSIWDKLSKVVQETIIQKGMLPKKSIRSCDWNALSLSARTLLIKNGYYQLKGDKFDQVTARILER